MPKIEILEKREKGNRLKVDEVYEKILKGQYPELFSNDKIESRMFFETYIKTYIERDIRELISVKDETKFLKFIESVAVRTAQELNYSTIAKEIGVDSKTIKNWISILESSGIIYLLQPFSSNLSNRIIKAPKLYFMDTGLCSYLAKYPNPETLEIGALSGAIFETFVVSEIIKNITSHGLDSKMNLYYYRDKDQKEVDLLYIEGDTICPIEIKKGISPNNPDKNFAVLNKYSNDIATGIVICMTQKLQPINRNCWLCPVSLL